MPNEKGISDVLDKLKRSRQRLLDLTLRNRLLNFRAGDPNFEDDLKAHKHLPLKGKLDSVWETLIEDGKKIAILCLTKAQQEQFYKWRRSEAPANSRALVPIGEAWNDAGESIRGVAASLQRGDLYSLLTEEAFGKRIKKMRQEQNTLTDSTGDSALFLAMGFLEWTEPEGHPKAGQQLFAPLVLIHVHLEEVRSTGGGERSNLIEMDLDQAQDNPCLAEKLRQDFSLDLPLLDEQDTISSYLAKVRRAVKQRKGWIVHNSIALGFFNFARYRLWLDLAPDQWPDGEGPGSHEVVKAILNGDYLEQKAAIPSEEEVAEHQQTSDLPVVLDADSTQYKALLGALNGASMVIVGPPGSGKSQTITNLIAVAIDQGKSVLFVAQKMAALSVVQRRLEDVGLKPFCLPIFSDKSRVTEVHKHLLSSAELKRDAWFSKGHHSSSAAVAEKLNEHASRLRETPPGFSENISRIIREATALMMHARENWGKAWDDRLLEITVPDGTPSQDWFAKREQTLHEWHRVKTEVGSSWSHWEPLTLGPLDASKIEGVARRQEEAAQELVTAISLLPKEFQTLTMGETQQLITRISRAKFSVLNNPLQALVTFLWHDPANQTAVARLEHDLEELERQRNKAQTHLRFTHEIRKYVAQRAAESLSVLNGVVSPKCTINEARAALQRLSEILRFMEDVVVHSSMLPEGITALHLPAGETTTRITWKHVEILSNHATDPDLALPAGTKLRLAQSILEDQTRLNSAKVFLEQLTDYHGAMNEALARIGGYNRFFQSEDRKDLGSYATTLIQHGLGDVRLKDLGELFQDVTGLTASLEGFIRSTAGTLPASAIGKESFKIEDPFTFAIFARFPEGSLVPPAASLPHLVLRLPNDDLNPSELEHFAAILESCQNNLSSLRIWFDSLKAKHQSNVEQTCKWLGLAKEARNLGLLEQKLGDIRSLRSITDSLRSKLQNTEKICTQFWHRLGLPEPTTLQGLRDGKKLLLLIANPPFIPHKLAPEKLGSAANVAAISNTIGESANLTDFRTLYASRIAFRDVPGVDEIARIRRELRPYAGRWWKWLSSRYRKARQAASGFLNPPFPSDADALTLLDNLDTHERSRLAFEQTPTRAILGEYFQGIETEWKHIEPVIIWVQDLAKASKLDNVSALIHQAIDQRGAVQETIAAIEEGINTLEAVEENLGKLGPIQALSKAVEPTGLKQLIEVLTEIDQSLTTLESGCAQIIVNHREQSVSDFLARVNEIQELQHRLKLLEQFTHLIASDNVEQIAPDSIRTTAQWLNRLTEQHLPPSTIFLLARAEINENQLRCISAAGTSVSETFPKVAIHFSGRQTPKWISNGASIETVSTALATITQAVQQTRRIVGSNAIDEHLTLSNAFDTLATVTEIERLGELISQWEPIFLEDPKKLACEDIASTLRFLARVRKGGVSGAFLAWLVADETQARLSWWQQLVGPAQDAYKSARRLQDDFLIPLQTPSHALDKWISDLADRCAKTTNSLEVTESCTHSGELTIHDCGQATQSLVKALEIEQKLEEWQPRLNVDPTTLKSASIADHRRWVTTVRSLPPVLGNWLAEDVLGLRSEQLLDLEPKHRNVGQAITNTKKLLEEFGKLDLKGPFGILSDEGTPDAISERARRMLSHLPQLPSYAVMLRERRRASELGIASLLMVVDGTTCTIERLIDTFRASVAWQQAKGIWEADEHLRLFSSNEFELLRKKFQDTDNRQLDQNRKNIAKRLAGTEVTEGSGGHFPRDLSEFQLLKHEASKRRKHLPIRKLVERAGKAMQDLSPCWMMTPLAVAQFLPGGSINFDIIIMDEASQLNPEDTWGAIARGKQLIVVGDPKQMPPSDFFSSTLEDDESQEEEEEMDGGKAESILEAAELSLHTAWLEWHYRSRQETLIAAANQFSYGNRLILFPSAHRDHPDLGIRYFFIDGAATTTGKVTSPKEAERIANRVYELVLAQYRRKPQERLSIGVVAMNIHQQECIQDLVDNLRRNDSRFDTALAALENETAEPLFIKNLENIQGDERDIMLISCTYGPNTPGGTPTQRFGPLNREGGERRFNVLITRAKWRMEVFASLKSQQIVTEGKNRGVQDFHLFLKYAETGRLQEPGEKTERGHDSPFEAQVQAVLCAAGFQVSPQIGVAGYFIDLGVHHPADKGRFALGIECDGHTYHSSKAARDRDRLREQVLRDRGWKLHRIWSTDWFVNHQQARSNLIKSVTAACR